MAKVLQRLDILLFANTAQYRSEMRDTQQSTTTMFGAIKADAANMAKVGAAAFAGMAAAGAAAIGVMIKEQVELAGEIAALAKVANTGTEQWQKLAIAAKSVGVESETLGDIYKDTQDKIGDFLSTGGGGMADFFENIAPQIGVTAEEFRNLSGPDALQKYYNGLQEANLGQSELIFYMEAVASDASALIPLLHDNGEGMRMWGEAAENAGAVMNDKTIVASQDMRAANDLMMLSMDGAKTQFTQAFIPVLADVANKLVSSGDAADIARKAGDFLVKTLKVVAQAGNVVITVFKTVGTVIGGAAATVMTLLDGVSITDSLLTTAVKIAGNGRAAAYVVRDIAYDTKTMWEDVRANNEIIGKLGTGTSNSYVEARKKQNALSDEIERQQGLTGQQYQAAADAAAKASEKSAKATEKEIKAQKNLGAAYVSNTQLSGLKLKSNEAIAGGQARGYTAEFAEVTQSLLGDKLRYFSAINDTYHKGKDSKHASGQAFDVVLKDAKQAAQAAAIIEQAAKKYGFNVKILNEYAKPSKNSTGGHLHVSVTGQAGVGADMQYIKQQNNAATQEQQRAAAEQARLLEQQAKDRVAIRMDYANEATRIEMQLADNIAKIKASGFSADETQAFIVDAQKRAAIELSSFEDTQAKKLDALGNFAKSERDIITQNTIYRAKEVLNDLSLTDEQRDQALALIKQKAVYELNQLDLVHAQEMQYAQQSEQTDIERITNQYALERREIQLTINMDEALRTAKIDALNQAEQYALAERRYAFENELSQLVNIGQSELANLRQGYAEQRRALDNRTDINDGQKSDLRNAMAGAQVYDTAQLQKNARDGYQSQQAQMQGTSENFALQQQLQARLDIVKAALDAEIITEEQALADKLEVRRQHEEAMAQLQTGQAELVAGSLSAITAETMGKQSNAYRAMFAIEKGVAIARSVMAIQVAMASAAASLPFPANLGAIVTVAAQVASIVSNIQAVRMPAAIEGQAHAGLDYVPREGTYLLDKGERVIKPADNRKLSDFLDGNDSNKSLTNVNMTIENHSGASIRQETDSEGRIRLIVGEELKRQAFNNRSDLHKGLKTNFDLRRNLA